MRTAALLMLLLLVGCRSTDEGTTPADAPDPNAAEGAIDEAPALDPAERFLDHPTVVRAETITAILPADLEAEVTVKGLSAGWREGNGRKTWEGTGEAEVHVRKLVLTGRSVTVTLVAEQESREILVQAAGDVSFGHAAPGGTQWEGKSFLMMRNDRWLER